jgi:hypothetical protein
MTFSRRLLRSLFVLLGLLGLMLVIVVVSQKGTVENLELVAQDTFVPTARVERLTVIAQTLAAPIRFDSLAADVSLEQACSKRQASLLTSRVAEQMDLGSYADARQRIGAAFAAAKAVAPVGCRGFLAEVDLILRNPTLLSVGQSATLQNRVTQTLTERVSWNLVPPCLYLNVEGEAAYLRGPQGYCLASDGEGQPSLASPIAVPATVRQIGNLAYARLIEPQSVTGSVTGSPPDPRRIEMTLHPSVSRALEGYATCWSSDLPCPVDRSVLQLSRYQGATVVVMDAQTGSVLGMRCFGPICDTGRLIDAEPLAPFLLEAPPASVAKLFFSLALAELAAPPKDLLLQIKTSGQLDPTAVKRNEWWERSAICDLQSRPPDAPPHTCAIAARAAQIAEIFGWNSRCADSPRSCGLVSVAPDLAPLPALVGRMQTLSALDSQGQGRPQDSLLERRYLNWNDYDRIRSAGGLTQIGQPYRESSVAIQAVLGAAEARTSALGLASLASGIFRLSQGQAPAAPRLLKPWGAPAHGLGVAASEAKGQASARPIRSLRSLAVPAQKVRQGMSKVLTPAEAGWTGDGTAHRAFLAGFGRSCPVDCPVEGKTGTVSARDPRFAGTTTFTGMAELPRLRALRGETTPKAFDLPPALALGVIVFSPATGQPAVGHAASYLAMHLLRDLSASPTAVQDTASP